MGHVRTIGFSILLSMFTLTAAQAAPSPRRIERKKPGTARTEELGREQHLSAVAVAHAWTGVPQEHGRPRGWTLERLPFMFETSIPGVFAAGDVRSGANRRVAAAVGEGSMAVQFVHQFLAASQKEVVVQQQTAA